MDRHLFGNTGKKYNKTSISIFKQTVTYCLCTSPCQLVRNTNNVLVLSDLLKELKPEERKGAKINFGLSLLEGPRHVVRGGGSIETN